MVARARSVANGLNYAEMPSKDHSGWVLGHLARRLKMIARARSVANGLN